MHMFLMGIFWYHLYDMSNYKLCNLDTYNHNFGSRVESFVYPSRGIRRGPETNKQYPSISRTDIAIHGDECSYCHPCFLKIAKFS